MPTDESEFLHDLEVEVDAELGMARSSRAEAMLDESPAEWPFDPTDVEREEVGLRNLRGALETMERGSRPAGEHSKLETDATSVSLSRRLRRPGPT
jgi:hypothetical protein